MQRRSPEPTQPPLIDPSEYGYGPQPPWRDESTSEARLELPERSPWPFVFGGFIGALLLVALTAIIVLAPTA